MAVFDKNQSKIKMVILTKHGHENKTWWSPINQNTRKSEFVIQGMLTRFKRHKTAAVTNMVQFFENEVKIYEHKMP